MKILINIKFLVLFVAAITMAMPTHITNAQSTLNQSDIEDFFGQGPASSDRVDSNNLPADIDPSGQSGVCLDLTRDLRLGWRDLGTNTEVLGLQDFLNANGYLDHQPTAYFGSLTFSAVQKFQSANGISPTGYVGPITRAKIKTITCSQAYSPTPTQTRTIEITRPAETTSTQTSTLIEKLIQQIANLQSQLNAIKSGQSTTPTTSTQQTTESQQANPDTPSITVTSPKGGEIWKAGNTYTINWDTNNGPNFVDIYALPVNANGDLIASGIKIAEHVSSSANGSSRYSWNISSSISSGSYKIGFMAPIVADPDGIYKQYNSNIFTISSSVTGPPQSTTTPVIDDARGILEDEFVVMSTGRLQITGSYLAGNYASTTYVYLGGHRLSLTQNPSDELIWAKAPDLPDGTYDLYVQNEKGKSNIVKIRVYQSEPSITVTSPNGGENWKIGSTYNITWEYSGPSDKNVTIVYYTPNSEMAQIASVKATSERYTWTVPDKAYFGGGGNEFKVGIIDPSNSNNLLDESNNFFTISQPTSTQQSITVTSPNGGDDWKIGNTYQIKWSSSEVNGNVSILLQDFGSYNSNPSQKPVGSTQIAEVSATAGSYSWTVPSNISTDRYYKIWVGTPFVSGQHQGDYISVSAEPSITVTSPNGGETFGAGQNTTISWNSNAIDNIKIEVCGGGSCFIEGNQNGFDASIGSYNWYIDPNHPLYPSSQLKIRITSLDSSSSSVFDESDGYFKVVIESGRSIDKNNALAGVLNSVKSILDTMVNSYADMSSQQTANILDAVRGVLNKAEEVNN